jgi:hypothetical protein
MKKLLIAAAAAVSLAAGAALAQVWDVSYAAGFSTAQNAGITAAREAYNLDHADAPLVDNGAYVQFVMTHAAQSYCVQYGVSGC